MLMRVIWGELKNVLEMVSILITKRQEHTENGEKRERERQGNSGILFLYHSLILSLLKDIVSET